MLSGRTCHPGRAAPPRRRLFADGPIRSLGLRKVDDATMLGRPGQAGARHHPCRQRNLVRRRAWYFSPAAAPPDRIPVPGLRPLPPSECSPEPRLRPEQGRGTGAAAAHRGDHDAARVGRSRRPLSEAVVRRTAATRRAGARWSVGRICSCSTSRCPRSTLLPESICGGSSGVGSSSCKS